LRGQQGKSVLIGVAQPGAILSEGVMLDDTPHGTSAVTHQGAKVWQISRAELDKVRAEKPDVFYRIVGQIARRLSDRLQAASERVAKEIGAPVLTNVRREHDSLGERDVPNHAYYGVQTIRAIENFPFSGIHVSHYEHFVRALACVKKAAALANAELGALDRKIADAMAKACDELLAGKLHDQFVVDMIQGGAGTSTNMCANEVIANRALELLGHKKGDYQFCHPNDHVNCSQSTNDAYPTAIKLGVWFKLRDTLSGLRELKLALEVKAKEFADVIKNGRTGRTRTLCP
jgi:aspartate ammonia-lyase